MTNLEKPLVTVILTAYNQEKYIEEALTSVFYQTYPYIQLIVIDNASKDNTLGVIESFKGKAPAFQVIRNRHNLGLCRAFNQGLSIAQGKYRPFGR
jgi:glycosyltransferase involved in cell wall biosynthesis